MAHCIIVRVLILVLMEEDGSGAIQSLPGHPEIVLILVLMEEDGSFTQTTYTRTDTYTS